MTRPATAIALLLALGLCGCKPYYREVLTPSTNSYWHETEFYWKERHPTTFHGICAHMYYGSDGNIWVIEHPYGVNPQTHGSLGTEQKTFPTRQAAENYAETLCPTK